LTIKFIIDVGPARLTGQNTLNIALIVAIK